MELENKVKGIGQELALFQQRYFAERENFNKRLDELNRRCEAIEAITNVLPIKVSELSKLVDKVAEAVVELLKIMTPKKGTKWWERILN
jgi:hypothetical protein